MYEIPEKARRDALQQVGFAINMEMRNQAPSSLKSGRGYRGPPLRNSIVNRFIDEETVAIGPTKKVDGIDLGLMTEKGSTTQTIIVPKRRKWLKFFWKKTGRIHFRKFVRRGVIPPNPFVKRTHDVMIQRIPKIVLKVFLNHYMREARRV